MASSTLKQYFCRVSCLFSLFYSLNKTFRSAEVCIKWRSKNLIMTYLQWVTLLYRGKYWTLFFIGSVWIVCRMSSVKHQLVLSQYTICWLLAAYLSLLPDFPHGSSLCIQYWREYIQAPVNACLHMWQKFRLKIEKFSNALKKIVDIFQYLNHSRIHHWNLLSIFFHWLLLPHSHGLHVRRQNAMGVSCCI